MSFTQSAENVRVDDGHILRASLRNGNGDNVDAEIDLNQFVGNDNGSTDKHFHYSQLLTGLQVTSAGVVKVFA